MAVECPPAATTCGCPLIGTRRWTSRSRCRTHFPRGRRHEVNGDQINEEIKREILERANRFLHYVDVSLSSGPGGDRGERLETSLTATLVEVNVTSRDMGHIVTQTIGMERVGR